MAILAICHVDRVVAYKGVSCLGHLMSAPRVLDAPWTVEASRYAVALPHQKPLYKGLGLLREEPVKGPLIVRAMVTPTQCDGCVCGALC